MLPVKPELPAADDATDLKPIGPEKPEQEEAPDAPRKRTKIRPPQDALSVQDRLFFLLQPPLENWLKGQELVMPFEPFQYQYEGIAWLFANKSALLADEMGLGKTMQTITSAAAPAAGRTGAARTAGLPQATDPELAARVQDLG